MIAHVVMCDAAAAALIACADHPFRVAVKKFLAGVLETSYVVDFASAGR